MSFINYAIVAVEPVYALHFATHLTSYGRVEEASQFLDVGVWGVFHLKPLLQ